MSDDMDRLEGIINVPNPYLDEMERLRREYNAAVANGLLIDAGLIDRRTKAIERQWKNGYVLSACKTCTHDHYELQRDWYHPCDVCRMQGDSCWVTNYDG